MRQSEIPDGKEYTVASPPANEKKLPPWLEKSGADKTSDKKIARAAVIQKRLAKMSKKGK